MPQNSPCTDASTDRSACFRLRRKLHMVASAAWWLSLSTGQGGTHDESSTIEARDTDDNVLTTMVIMSGDPMTGDGVATPWNLIRAQPDVARLVFMGDRHRPGFFGLGFDNFDARSAPDSDGDGDGDGVFDNMDNCIDDVNADQRDRMRTVSATSAMPISPTTVRSTSAISPRCSRPTLRPRFAHSHGLPGAPGPGPGSSPLKNVDLRKARSPKLTEPSESKSASAS